MHMYCILIPLQFRALVCEGFKWVAIYTPMYMYIGYACVDALFGTHIYMYIDM